MPTGFTAGKLRQNFNTQHMRVEVGVDVGVGIGLRVELGLSWAIGVGLRVESGLSRAIGVGFALCWCGWRWVVVVWGFSSGGPRRHEAGLNPISCSLPSASSP